MIWNEICPKNHNIKIGKRDSLSSILNCDLPFDTYNYNMKVSFKTHKSGFSMKMHVDDCNLIKIKKDFQEMDNKKIYYKNDKYCLMYYNKLPTYTLLYYTDVNNCFGGELNIMNYKIIKPENDMFILFDSKIPHSVNLLKEGIRKNIIIKFYKKKIEEKIS